MRARPGLHAAGAPLVAEHRLWVHGLSSSERRLWAHGLSSCEHRHTCSVVVSTGSGHTGSVVVSAGCSCTGSGVVSAGSGLWVSGVVSAGSGCTGSGAVSTGCSCKGSVAVSAGCSCTGSGVVSAGSRCSGSVIVAQGLRCSSAWGKSFQSRDRTCVPCIFRWILNHWTTREALYSSFWLSRVLVPLIVQRSPVLLIPIFSKCASFLFPISVVAFTATWFLKAETWPHSTHSSKPHIHALGRFLFPRVPSFPLLR